MKVIIIEDEKLSAEHLNRLLQKTGNNIEVVQYLDTVKAATDAFKGGLQADLLFLDIHLADGNCFEIFTKIRIDIPIIFTTAFDNYAIQAFKQNSVDYLLKPISLEDLQYALEKYKKQQKIISNNLLENITYAFQQINKNYKSRFLVKIGQTIHTIQTDDVHHFETQESITFLVTSKGSKYPVDYTMDQLGIILQPKEFFRINRKILIHIKSIEKVENYFNSRLVIKTKFLEGDTKIVSRERVNNFKLWLDD